MQTGTVQTPVTSKKAWRALGRVRAFLPERELDEVLSIESEHPDERTNIDGREDWVNKYVHCEQGASSQGELRGELTACAVPVGQKRDTVWSKTVVRCTILTHYTCESEI